MEQLAQAAVKKKGFQSAAKCHFALWDLSINHASTPPQNTHVQLDAPIYHKDAHCYCSWKEHSKHISSPSVYQQGKSAWNSCMYLGRVF